MPLELRTKRLSGTGAWLPDHPERPQPDFITDHGRNATYPELQRMRDDMREQDSRYRPTSFWEEAAMRIGEAFETDGVESFRRQALPLSYFVPTYGLPGNGFTPDEAARLRSVLGGDGGGKAVASLDQFLEGESWALADYRVLLAADDTGCLPWLHRFSESRVGAPREQFEFDGRRFSRSSLNYLLGLAFLKKHLGDESIRTVLEIGGGFGTLGEVLASSGIEGLRYVNLDVPPTAYAAQYYLSEVLGSEQVATYAATREMAEIEIKTLPFASVLCAWQIERLMGNVDLFVNFISFQEMEPAIVRNYLSQVHRLGTKWVLLRNMREGKQRRTASNAVGVETPILGEDYLAMLPGYELVGRNVHPFGYRTVDGYHSELLLLRRGADA